MYNKTIKDLDKVIDALDAQREYIDRGHHSYIDRNMCLFLSHFIQNSAEYIALLRERNRLRDELTQITRKLENL